MIFICNFHVLSNLLLIFICKLHWKGEDTSALKKFAYTIFSVDHSYDFVHGLDTKKDAKVTQKNTHTPQTLD